MAKPMHAHSSHTEDPNLWHPIIRFMHWLGQYELTILVAAVLVVGGLWIFIDLADEVVEGETHAIDTRILLLMRNPADPADPIGPPWVEEMGRDFTALGGVGVLFLITITVSTYLLLQHKFGAMTLVLVAVGGGVLLSLLLKLGFDRPRPELVPHGSYVATASFPSGHSMLSAVTYLTLGALLARLHPQRRFKAFFLLVAGLVTFLVGVSRIYLGVHWPTDVLAGWTLGGVWALICWLAARWLQARGQVEEDINEPESDEE